MTQRRHFVSTLCNRKGRESVTLRNRKDSRISNLAENPKCSLFLSVFRGLRIAGELNAVMSVRGGCRPEGLVFGGGDEPWDTKKLATFIKI
jgi:hypothetical protein